MRRRNLSFAFALTLALGCTAAQAEPLKASNTPKALLGANGERADIVEVNSSTQIVVRISGVGGEWEGKTFVWSFEDLSAGRKNAFIETKRGSKTQRYNALIFRDGLWELYPVDKGNDGIALAVSKKESAALSADELIRSAQVR